MEIVGSAAMGIALCNLGLLRKPILFRRRSCVNCMCFGVCEGTLVNGKGDGVCSRDCVDKSGDNEFGSLSRDGVSNCVGVSGGA